MELVREREGCGRAYICLSASTRLLVFFLDQDTGLKNLVQFLYFRKHFHNFKYNHFLFGEMLGISHVYLAFIYLFSSPERKGLKKKRELTDSKWSDLWPLILNGF